MEEREREGEFPTTESGAAERSRACVDAAPFASLPFSKVYEKKSGAPPSPPPPPPPRSRTQYGEEKGNGRKSSGADEERARIRRPVPGKIHFHLLSSLGKSRDPRLPNPRLLLSVSKLFISLS